MLTLALGLLLTIGGRAGVATATPEGGADGPPESGPASVEVHVAACEPGYDGTDFFADCHSRGVAGVAITLTSRSSAIEAAALTEILADPGPGVAVFDGLPADEYTVTVEIPGHDASFESYCSAANGETAVPLAPEDANEGTFTLAAGQAVVCDWYAIPFEQLPMASARIDLDVSVCDASFDAAGSGANRFAAACTEPADDVGFTLSAESGDERSNRTDAAGAVAFAGLPPGSYELVSDVPGEFAREYLFCSAAGGDIYEKRFNDVGVTTFANLAAEQLACDWYIVPFDLRGSGRDEPPVTPTPAPPVEDSAGPGEVTVTALPRTGAGVIDTADDRGWMPPVMTLGLLGFTWVALRWDGGRPRPARRPVRTSDPRRAGRA